MRFQQIVKLAGLAAVAVSALVSFLKELPLFTRRGYEERDLSGAAECIPETGLLDQPQTHRGSLTAEDDGGDAV